MSHTSTTIFINTNTTPHKGVEIADIQAVLNLPNNDIGGLIRQGVLQDKINKWAKYKPIHYPGKYIMSDDDFRGRLIDTTQNGLVYGLRAPSQISVIDPTEFHSVTWAYEGYPNATGLSGTSMWRFLDFNGYNANAVPNLYGQIPDSSKFYIGATVAVCTAYSAVNEGYRQSNNDGVDLARYVVDGLTMTDEQLMARLSQCYPAILIGNYITAVGVYNSTSGQVDYGTIVRSNGSGGYVVANPNWCLDMTKLAKATVGDDYAPWSSNTNEVATLVLVYTGNSNPYLLNGDPSTDITQYWIDLTGREQDPWTARVFPLPGACGEPVAITRYEAGYTVTPREIISCSTSSVTVGFDVLYVGSESATGRATITAQVGIGGTQKQTLLLLVSGGPATVTFNATDFDMQMFMPNTTYTITINTVATVDNVPGSNTAYGTLNFTP